MIKMNKYSQLLKLASKLDEKGLVKEADSIERLLKLAWGGTPGLRELGGHYPLESVQPVVRQQLRERSGRFMPSVIPATEWSGRGLVPPSERAAEELLPAAERTIAKPSNLRMLGKLGLLGAGAYGLYKGGQWIGNQLMSDLGPQPQGPQPSGPQPIYPGAYTPPIAMNDPSIFSGRPTSPYQCSYCGGPIAYEAGVVDKGIGCNNCGAFTGSGWGGDHGPTASPWKEQYEQQRQAELQYLQKWLKDNYRQR
jgi:hypothetical protein